MYLCTVNTDVMLKYLLTIAVIWLVYRQIKQSSLPPEREERRPLRDLEDKTPKKETEYIDYEDVN